MKVSDDYVNISGYRFRISEAWEASYICEYKVKFPRYQFFIIQFWLLHYCIELSYKALLLFNGIKPPENHRLVNLHGLLLKACPEVKGIINFDRIKELDKFGDERGGIRYPENLPREWQHTRSIWKDLEPFKVYALERTYKSDKSKH